MVEGWDWRSFEVPSNLNQPMICLKIHIENINEITKNFLNSPLHLHTRLGDGVLCTGGFFGINVDTIRKDSSKIVVGTFLLCVLSIILLMGVNRSNSELLPYGISCVASLFSCGLSSEENRELQEHIRDKSKMSGAVLEVDCN